MDCIPGVCTWPRFQNLRVATLKIIIRKTNKKEACSNITKCPFFWGGGRYTIHLTISYFANKM